MMKSRQTENRYSLQNVDLDLLIKNPNQPRKLFDQKKLEELACSIKDIGLLQPVVTRKKTGHYEIVAGERRWRACQLAGVKEIPILVHQYTDEESAISAISENTQREDLNLLEMAHAFFRLNDEFAMTHSEIGNHFKIHEKNVTHILRLLTLDLDIQKLVEQGDIKLGHAKVILSVQELHRRSLAKKIIKSGLSVRAAEKIAKQLNNPNPQKKASKDRDVVCLEERISGTVGLETSINYAPNGRGKIEFGFSNFEELDGLLERLKVLDDF